MKHILLLAMALLCIRSYGQNVLSINVLKPAFYFFDKQDFMTDVVFDHYFKKQFALRIGLHGGFQNAPSGLPVKYFNSTEKFLLEQSQSFGIGASVGIKIHPKTVNAWPAPDRFYGVFQLQAGRFTDIQKINIVYPCCYVGDVTYNSGFLKFGWLLGYDIRVKSLQFAPELGIILPWASEIGTSNNKTLVWVNQIRFQWHIALNVGYIFNDGAYPAPPTE